MPGNMRDIIFIGGIDWDSPVCLPAHHVVRELSERHRVFYVDNFGAGRPVRLADFPRIVRKARSLLTGHRRGENGIPAPGIHVHMPALLPLPQSRIVARLNGILLAYNLRKLCRTYRVHEPILWTRVRTDTVVVALKHLSYSLLVLQVVDNAPFSPVIPSWMRQRMLDADKALTKMADVVFVSAYGLLNERKVHNHNTYFFPNGVDARLFSGPLPERPPYLKVIKAPVVLFAGSIGASVNLELIRDAARSLPDVSFLLLGPQRVDMTQVTQVNNVYAPGPVPFSDLIAYCRHSAVGIIPYRVDEFTTYTFPSKLFEYFAAGMPVVATWLPELHVFDAEVEMTRTTDEFIEGIRRGLRYSTSVGDQPRRMALAQEYSWKHLVYRMEERIEAALEGRQSAPWREKD